MNVEDLLNHLNFDSGAQKHGKVTVSLYACGQVHKVPLEYNRIQVDKNGNVNIDVEDN